jgi:pectate lyase
MSVVYGTNGIQTAEALQLSMFPNPVQNSLYVSTDATVQKVDIYSLTGLLMQQTVGNTKTIDMSRLSSGSYLVKIFTEQGIIKQMIIKK